MAYFPAEAETMSALLVNMEFKSHTVLSQCGRKKNRILDIHGGIFPGVPEETRRGIGCDLLLVGKQPDQLRRRILSQ